MDNYPKPCLLYNCKRTYTNADALQDHLRDHHNNPAQSLPGRSFLCSTIGCDGSFSSMQELMDHMRHHYKPNNFFLCESCRAKLRSYRTLLKHLQTCAKVAKSKLSQPEVTTPNDSAPPSTEPDPSGSLMPSEASQEWTHESSTPFIPATVQPQNLQDAVHTTFQPSLSTMLDAELQRSPKFSPASTVSTAVVGGPESSSVQSLPGSNAVWRKNQDVQMELSSGFNERRSAGQSFSSRILWEHTRGRYSCLQCGHSTPDRQEMTAHIEGQHRSPGVKTNHDSEAVGGSTLIHSTTEIQTPKYLAL